MKYAVLLTLLLTGCAAKKPHKMNMFEFHGIHQDGTCVVDNQQSHWNAKGAFVVICKP